MGRRLPSDCRAICCSDLIGIASREPVAGEHHSDDPAILDDRGLNAVVARELLAGALDERQRVLGRLPVRPRQPVPLYARRL